VLCQSLKLGFTVMKLGFTVMKLGFTVMKLGFTVMKLGFTVIPAQAGIQIAALVSRLRGNDVTQKLRFDKALVIPTQPAIVRFSAHRCEKAVCGEMLPAPGSGFDSRQRHGPAAIKKPPDTGRAVCEFAMQGRGHHEPEGYGNSTPLICT
jgi:hypothetical protein